MTLSDNHTVSSYLEQFLNYEKKPSRITADSYQEFCTSVYSLYSDIINHLPVIHLAGTKGKTSLTWLLQQALTKKGYKAGTFTSPHLYRYEERICIDGLPISDQVLLKYLQCAASEKRYSPAGNLRSVFELLFLASLRYFSEQKTDYAVYETGLGGRLDATNVFPRPRLVLLTPVHKDHTRFLGKTLEKIAGEKAGIMKKDVPALSFPQLREVKKVFLQKSRDIGCPLEILPPSALDPASMLRTINKRFPVNIAQVQNALFLKKAVSCLGLDISDQDILSLLEQPVPGRWEVSPVHEKTVIFDGAHCPLSAANLRNNLDYYFPGKPVSFIFSFMRDKQYRKITSTLLRNGDTVFYYPSALPRSLEYTAYKNWFTRSYPHEIQLLSEPVSAEHFPGRVICVTGSFYHLTRVKSWIIPSNMSTTP